MTERNFRQQLKECICRLDKAQKEADRAIKDRDSLMSQYGFQLLKNKGISKGDKITVTGGIDAFFVGMDDNYFLINKVKKDGTASMASAGLHYNLTDVENIYKHKGEPQDDQD